MNEEKLTELQKLKEKRDNLIIFIKNADNYLSYEFLKLRLKYVEDRIKELEESDEK